MACASPGKNESFHSRGSNHSQGKLVAITLQKTLQVARSFESLSYHLLLLDQKLNVTESSVKEVPSLAAAL